MNRGVMVTRGKPDEEELVLSAGYVCYKKTMYEFLNQFLYHIPSIVVILKALHCAHLGHNVKSFDFINLRPKAVMYMQVQQIFF